MRSLRLALLLWVNVKSDLKKKKSSFSQQWAKSWGIFERLGKEAYLQILWFVYKESMRQEHFKFRSLQIVRGVFIGEGKKKETEGLDLLIPYWADIYCYCPDIHIQRLKTLCVCTSPWLLSLITLLQTIEKTWLHWSTKPSTAHS